jgi:hypothetical protein
MRAWQLKDSWEVEGGASVRELDNYITSSRPPSGSGDQAFALWPSYAVPTVQALLLVFKRTVCSCRFAGLPVRNCSSDNMQFRIPDKWAVEREGMRGHATVGCWPP